VYLSDLAHGRNNNFNLIRILAALAVLINHSFPLTGLEEPFGQALGMTAGTWAVDIFFLSSGFLVSASLLRRNSAIDYLISRIFRIFPALIVASFISAFIIGSYFTSYSLEHYLNDPETLAYFLKASTVIGGISMQLPGVFEDNPYPDAVNGSLWTIIYELKMYLLLLLVWSVSKISIRIMGKSLVLPKLRILVALMSSVSGLILISDSFQQRPESHLCRFIFMFFTGVMFYLERRHIRLSPRIFWIALLSLIAAAFVDSHLFMLAYCLSLAYLLFFLVYVPKGLIRKFNDLGDYSYGVYIYAFPIQQSIVAIAPEIQMPALAALSLMATMFCAVFSWHLIEFPLLRNKDVFLVRMRDHLFFLRDLK